MACPPLFSGAPLQPHRCPNASRAARAYLIILMEYCPANLLDLVLDNYPLPPPLARFLMRELAEILGRLSGRITDAFVVKDLKPSTRQRFVSLAFEYPEPDQEAAIVCREGGVDQDLARLLVRFATMTRSLRDSGLPEGASTRLLIQVGKLVAEGIELRTACRAAVTQSLTDDPELLAAIDEMVASLF